MASGVLASLVNSAVTLVGYAVFTNFLGLETYGLWLLLATFLQLAMLGDLGVSQSLTKLVSEARGRGELTAIQQYVAAALLVLAGSGVVMLLGVMVVLPWIGSLLSLNPEQEQTVRWLLPLVSLLSTYALVCQVYRAVLAGFSRIDLANYISSASRSCGIVTSIVLVFCDAGIYAMLSGSVLTCVLSHVLMVLALRKQNDFELSFSRIPDRLHFTRLVGFSASVFSASLMNNLFNPWNKFLLCYVCGVSSVPIYEIALQSAMQLRSLVDSALRAILPEVSFSHSKDQGSWVRIKNLYDKTFRFVLLYASPCYVLALISLKPLLTLWLGAEFAVSLRPVMTVMLIASYLNLLCVPAFYTLMGMGQVRSICFAGGLLLIANAISSLFLALFTSWLTPFSIACCVMLAFGTSAAYLIRTNMKHLASSELSEGNDASAVAYPRSKVPRASERARVAAAAK